MPAFGLRALQYMNTYCGIGLMSGTSLDGIDLAYCQFRFDQSKAWSYQILDANTFAYPPGWRKRLAGAQAGSAEAYARTDMEYGHFLGSRLQDFISSRRIAPDYVASHGHTIFHQPETGFTAQIGDGETISAYLACPLVSNFRNKDVALKGQGAPLVPFGEKHLFPGCRLFLNLGGFSNLTADGSAFDVSPCNFALNWAVKRLDPALDFDPDGQFARAGTLHSRLFRRLEALEYYDRPPPKSLGREWFEECFLPVLTAEKEVAPQDLLCTLCHHIASQISRAIAASGIRDTTIIVTGGGARNRFLAELLDEGLRQHRVSFEVDIGTNLIDYKEALIFAFLGLQVLLGRPNILPEVTGATRGAVAGSIHLPPEAEKFALLKG